MGILCDWEIKVLVHTDGMLDPFVGHQVKIKDGQPCVSYGLSSYGYDVRMGKTVTIPKRGMFDPHNPSMMIWDTAMVTDFFIMQPREVVLVETMERFNMPANVTGICQGKSTYARCGLHVNVTPLEAGWAGVLTVELHNQSMFPVKIWSGEGIAQIQFFRGDKMCITSYADRQGKYQDQAGVTPAIT